MLVGCTPLAKVFANSLGDSCEGRGKVDEQWSELGDSCEGRGKVDEQWRSLSTRKERAPWSPADSTMMLL